MKIFRQIHAMKTILIILFLAGSASAATLNVNTTGWWFDPLLFNASSSPIQAGIDNATSGDTINVSAGTYGEI